MNTLVSTRDIALAPSFEGKVRDVFDLGDELLIVTTDRISAYDVILPDPLPGKGILLTQMTIGWFEYFADELRTHYLTDQIDEVPQPFRGRDELAGRSMLVRKARRYDAECVVRGYLSGSGWREYERDGKVCGIELPPGLLQSARLPEPIFTPATKAEEGHDENISFEQMCEIVPPDVAVRLRDLSIDIYNRGAAFAAARGIILADTKFEFGEIDGEIALIDEMLSPDSSRFWPADLYQPGRGQQSFDKQFVRDYLDQTGWDHTPPAPRLTPEVIANSVARYREAYDRLFPNRKLELA